ncbi:unnamed protein product [Leptidea sinapis]|uniref:Uncharacterized protein n=1 Tax=Leptidea sinapis TaxID=189913 RepID=A0A5E4Q5U3_9NEOP|nr:unnamed protein product [Leptidea sinapis]
MSFDSKVVIVTGASSGIGAAIAIAFAKAGANVVLVGRNEENLTVDLDSSHVPSTWNSMLCVETKSYSCNSSLRNGFCSVMSLNRNSLTRALVFDI